MGKLIKTIASFALAAQMAPMVDAQQRLETVVVSGTRAIDACLNVMSDSCGWGDLNLGDISADGGAYFGMEGDEVTIVFEDVQVARTTPRCNRETMIRSTGHFSKPPSHVERVNADDGDHDHPAHQAIVLLAPPAQH